MSLFLMRIKSQVIQSYFGLEGDQTLNLEVLIALMVLLIFFLIALLMFSRKQRKVIANQKKEVEQLLELKQEMNVLKMKNERLQRDKLEKELSFKKKDLLNFSIDLERKRSFVHEVLKKLNQLPKSHAVKDIIFFVKSQLQIDESQRLLHENIDKINHEFLTMLQKHYPTLTSNEQQICALLRINLTTKEIAAVKNVSADSVKVMRHRLRKKMNLASHVDLNDFLIHLS